MDFLNGYFQAWKIHGNKSNPREMSNIQMFIYTVYILYALELLLLV